MSIIEIIRTKPKKTFSTIVSRAAIARVEYEGDSDIVIHLLGGERIVLQSPQVEDAAQAYDDIRIALQQPSGTSSVINISLV